LKKKQNRTDKNPVAPTVNGRNIERKKKTLPKQLKSLPQKTAANNTQKPSQHL